MLPLPLGLLQTVEALQKGMGGMQFHFKSLVNLNLAATGTTPYTMSKQQHLHISTQGVLHHNRAILARFSTPSTNRWRMPIRLLSINSKCCAETRRREDLTVPIGRWQLPPRHCTSFTFFECSTSFFFFFFERKFKKNPTKMVQHARNYVRLTKI